MNFLKFISPKIVLSIHPYSILKYFLMKNISLNKTYTQIY